MMTLQMQMQMHAKSKTFLRNLHMRANRMPLIGPCNHNNINKNQ